MFEIELIIYIKMDLALDNLQRLICHKTQPTNQPIANLKHLSPWSYLYLNTRSVCSVGWSCRINWLRLCWGLRPHPNEHPRYDIKQSDGVVPVMLELWGMWHSSSLPLLPGPLCPGVVALGRVQSMDQIELNCVLMHN